ncbi:MFS transporter [Chloroflexota bacterium]
MSQRQTTKAKAELIRTESQSLTLDSTPDDFEQDINNQFEKYGPKITLALLASQSLFSASLIMAFTVGSIIVLQLTDNNSRWAGVPATLHLAGAALMAYPMGRLMDRVGRRIGLSMGYIYGIFGALLAGIAVVQENLWLFLSGIVFLGFTKGVIDQGRFAAAEANLPQKRARAISLVVLGGTVGSIVGPTLIKLTGNFADSLSLPTLSGVWFMIMVFFTISLVIINLFLRPDPQFIAKQLNLTSNRESDRSSQGRDLKILLKIPAIKLAMGTMIVGQLVMLLIMAITPVHMHLNHHEIGAISLVIMAHTLGMFGLSFMTGWLVDKLGASRMIITGSLTLIAACLISPVSNEIVWLASGLFLLGLGWNFCYVSGSALLAGHLLPGEQGKVQGINDTLINLSSAVGSLGSGLIFAAIGFAAMSWLSILVALIPIQLVIIFGTAKVAQDFAQQ